MVKTVFWAWFIILLVLNVIPLGSGTSQSMSTSRAIIRLDYLIHMITFLGFAWIYVLGETLAKPVYDRKDTTKMIFIILVSAVGFEGLQWFLPYRSFNPIDMVYNLLGVYLAVGFILVSCRLAQIKSADFRR